MAVEEVPSAGNGRSTPQQAFVGSVGGAAQREWGQQPAHRAEQQEPTAHTGVRKGRRQAESPPVRERPTQRQSSRELDAEMER